jgi:tetratricopeptide (TPR) repeat protein
MFSRAAKILEKTSGMTSADLLPSLDGLASAFENMHRQTDAETVWRRALSIRESAFGPSTVDVAATLDSLGKLYFEQKRYPEAGYCYERELYIRQKAHGDDSADTQATLSTVAQVYAAEGRQSDAEPLFRGMLTAKELDTVASLNSLAALLGSRERNAEAESLYKLSIALLDKKGFVTARKPVLNPNDPPPPQLAETLDQYTALLKKMHKKSDAAKMETRARILHGIPESAAATKKKTK